ncbi:chitin-binding protein [Bacillus cereus]|uniref:Chitin-binding protein n=2 Tax=Bacillus cereus TaxID=1396 RepID=A0A2C0EGQ3_BACCE|nr:discoidin domain-containing protein [Bacillus cereus]PFA13560.1 chitin-binding protein [Bacillus cereus]PGQ05136.1 chitin-binding protein [Bacillus cereus]
MERIEKERMIYMKKRNNFMFQKPMKVLATSAILATTLFTPTLTNSLTAQAETVSSNLEIFNLETLNQKTDQAIANGNFEGHLSYLSAYLNVKIGNITGAGLQNKLADPAFSAALAQWQLISQTGAAAMNTFAKKDAEHQKFLSWTMKNTDVMNTYLEGGSPTGNNPVNALEIWNTIWNADADSHQGLYLKLAIATSLAHAEPIKYWTNNKPINPLTRYQHYKSADQNNELLPCFRTYDVWHLRLVVNTWSPEEDLTWARKMINTEHPELKSQDKIGTSAYLIQYVTNNKDGVSVQAGNDAFYGSGWNLSSIYRNGAVCGGISKFGVQVSQAFGVAAMPVTQPGHCALIWNDKPSSWNLGNDIFGWGESGRHDVTVIPWSDNSLKNQVPNILLFENAGRDSVKLDQSERLRWLAKAISSSAKKSAIYKTATNILPINVLVWKDYVSLMLQNPNVTDAEWQELNNSIVSSFANEPRPMMDLLAQIKSHVLNTSDRAKLQQYTLNILNAFSTITNVNEKQVANNIKAQMPSLGLCLATFSFDGANAGKLMGIKTDTEYSIDGGKTYKAATSNDMLLSNEEISAINSTDGILTRVIGTEQPLLIPIGKAGKVNVYANDDENSVFGLDGTMEFSIDQGSHWTKYNPAAPNLPNLTGNVTLTVRKFATGLNPAGDAVNLKFTDTSVAGLIPRQNLSIAGFSSQQDSDGNAATNAIDGNPATMWHTFWNGSDKAPYITLKLNEVTNISQLAYVPRQGGNPNGNITSYNIYTSMDGINFTKVATGTWEDNNLTKNASFSKVNAQYVKLEVVSGHGGFASASEIKLYKN